MGAEDSSSSDWNSFWSSKWGTYKSHWRERLEYLDKYKKIYARDKPLPKWSDADVEEFVLADPVYGPQLQLTRQAAKISAVGSLICAVSTAGITLKYSKSGIGTILSLGAGAAIGWVFGKEVANHTLQLYKFDPMNSQIKFFDWWEKKTEGRS